MVKKLPLVSVPQHFTQSPVTQLAIFFPENILFRRGRVMAVWDVYKPRNSSGDAHGFSVCLSRGHGSGKK